MKRKERSLQELFSDYVSDCKYSLRRRKETIRGYEHTFRLLTKIKPELVSPELVTAQALTDFFKKLSTRERIVGKGEKRSGVKNSTIATYRSKLHSFFEWLQARGHIPENPLKNIPAPEVIYDDKCALEKKDVEKLISAVNFRPKNPLTMKRDIAMIYLLLLCGLRRGELVGLQVRDIDMEKRVLTVRGETSKSKHTRQLPINRQLVMRLDDYLEERNKRGYKTQYLIVSNNQDQGISTYGLAHWVKRLRQLSGVRFHLHQFRHTFTCALGKRNTSAIIIQKLLGHTDLRMTQRYLRSLSVEDLRDEVEKLNIEDFD